MPIQSNARYVEVSWREERLPAMEVVATEFEDCCLVACHLSRSIFRDCRFLRCAFVQCDLSLMQVPGSLFSQCTFEDCTAVGINWSAARWPQARLGPPLAFQRCVLNHSTFIGLNLSGVRVVDCIAHDADWREANLTVADLSGTDLTASLFNRTNLTNADLHRARNYRLRPADNTLCGARFALPEAMSLLYELDIVLVDDDNRPVAGDTLEMV